MLNAQTNRPSRAIQILVLFVLSLAGLIFTSFVVLLVPSLSDPTNANTLLLLQALQAILLFIIPALIAAKLFHGEPLGFMALDRKPSWIALGVVVAVFVISLPALNWVTKWNEGIELPASMKTLETALKKAEETARVATETLMSGSSWMSLLATVFVVGILPGISEEMFFRGGLYRLSSPTWKENHIMIWVVGIVFSAFHLQFYGFVPRMLLGAWFAYLLVWTRSLWVPIVAHALNNSMVVLVTFLGNRGIIEEDSLDNLGLSSPGQWPWLAMVSAVCTLGVILLARKTFLKKMPDK